MLTIEEHIKKGHICVRCPDRMTFWVDPVTLEPFHCGSFDEWCYTHPYPDAVYMEHSEWDLKHQAITRKK